MKRTAWIHSPGYLQGILWMCLVCLISSTNDTLTKYVGSRLSGAEIAFFRFFFSTIVLLPFMIVKGKQAFVTRYPTAHFVRSLLLVIAMMAWSYGVPNFPLTLATTISFTTPLFVQLLAKFFLKEKIGWQRSMITVLGFIGILISVQPGKNTFNPMAIILVASTFMFATIDVINKKLLIEDETLLGMLFYSGIGTTLLGLIPALLTWQTPSFEELFFLALLGSGGSLVLFCLLKAFAATEISALQSFRYTEFAVSCCFGFIIFKEWPSFNILLGAAIIIPATFYIALYETKKTAKEA